MQIDNSDSPLSVKQFLLMEFNTGVGQPTARFVLGDRYELISVVGKGATSIVFLARDQVLSRDVAIKIWALHGGGTGWNYGASDEIYSLNQRDYFLAEARRLARVRHVNLATILDFGVSSEGVPWLALELIPGDTLRGVLRRWSAGESRGLGDVLDIATQIAAAAGYLHGQGMYQLDLKPENVLVGDERVAVIDVASALERPSADNNLTRARYGTPGYAAPEIVSGGEVTPAADVFSLSVMLIEMLTLTNPLAEREMMESAYRALGIREVDMYLDFTTAAFWPDHQGDLQKWASTYRHLVAELDVPALLGGVKWAIPKELSDLITAGIRPSPEQRPHDATEVASELATIQANVALGGSVFISHAHRDKGRFVDALAEELSDRGITVWYDSWNLRTGEPFWDRIMDAVDGAAFVALVLSENSIRSDAVAEELRIARLGNQSRVKLLPILIDDLEISALPPDLRTRQVMRFPLPEESDAFASAVAKLLGDIRALAADTG